MGGNEGKGRGTLRIFGAAEVLEGGGMFSCWAKGWVRPRTDLTDPAVSTATLEAAAEGKEKQGRLRDS
jgi:hypothetical protein